MFLSSSGAWGAPWKHTKDMCSRRAPKPPPRLAVPDRSLLGPLDQSPQTPFWFCLAPSWPMAVPMPSLPSVLPSARPGPDAVGNSFPSWAHTMAHLQPHLWHCLPPWWASVSGCWLQLCPLSSGPAGQCSLGRAWPSLGSPTVLWTCAACEHSWLSWPQSLGWDHFLDQPDFVPSSQRNAMSSWKGKGSFSLMLSPTPNCCMERLQAAKGSLCETGTCLGICYTIMVCAAMGTTGLPIHVLWRPVSSPSWSCATRVCGTGTSACGAPLMSVWTLTIRSCGKNKWASN